MTKSRALAGTMVGIVTLLASSGAGAEGMLDRARRFVPALDQHQFRAPETFARYAAPASLQPVVIESVRRRHQSEVRSCFDRTMGSTRAVETTFELAFTIEPNGRVASTWLPEIESDAPMVVDGFDGLVRCVSAHVRRWHFPAAEAPTDGRLSFSFVAVR